MLSAYAAGSQHPVCNVGLIACELCEVTATHSFSTSYMLSRPANKQRCPQSHVCLIERVLVGHAVCDAVTLPGMRLCRQDTGAVTSGSLAATARLSLTVVQAELPPDSGMW